MEIPWLKHDEICPMGNDDKAYSLERISKEFEITPLSKSAWLVLNWNEEKYWLKFVVFDFFYSDADNKNVMLQPVFHGEGTGGALRECRHTWWGDNGYIFYPNKNTIELALKELSKYFDFD